MIGVVLAGREERLFPGEDSHRSACAGVFGMGCKASGQGEDGIALVSI